MRPHGVHHIHKRKRFYQEGKELEQKIVNEFEKKILPYPHSDKWIHFLDEFLLAVAVIAPLMNLPQIIKILIEKDASGVSLISWIMYTVMAIPWLIYGLVHKEKPIIVSYSLWLLLNSAVVIAALVYG